MYEIYNLKNKIKYELINMDFRADFYAQFYGLWMIYKDLF